MDEDIKKKLFITVEESSENDEKMRSGSFPFFSKITKSTFNKTFDWRY